MGNFIKKRVFSWVSLTVRGPSFQGEIFVWHHWQNSLIYRIYLPNWNAVKDPLSFRLLKATLKPLAWLFPRALAHFWIRQFMKPSKISAPGWESELLASGTPITLPGKIKAWIFGEGPVVLLAHGWEGRGGQMGKFITPLVRAGFRVVTFDGIAHGETPGTKTNIVMHAESIVEISSDLDARYGPVHAVIAHSFGAGATALALTLGLKITKVILIASPCSIQNILNRFTDSIELPERARRAFQNILEMSTGYPASAINVATLSEKIENVDALIIHDSKDEDVPYSEACEIASHWKNSILFTVEGVGHRRILKSKIVIERCVQFLTETKEGKS